MNANDQNVHIVLTGITSRPSILKKHQSLDCFDATPANRRIFVVHANVGFPMPAAFAFLAVGFGN